MTCVHHDQPRRRNHPQFKLFLHHQSPPKKEILNFTEAEVA